MGCAWGFRGVVLVILLGTAWGKTLADEPLGTPVRGEIVLPARDGPAQVSAQITLQSSYLASLGDRVVPAAGAGGAAVDDSRGAAAWAATYFGRRELARAHGFQVRSIHVADETVQREMLDRRVRRFFQETFQGDLTAELNWLLHQLATMTLPYEYLTLDGDPRLPGPLDAPLDAHDVHHIRLTDGGRDKGQLLVFRADSANVLETPWPRALRDARFATLCAEFERTRDEVLGARAKGQRDREAERRLMAACDRLTEQFSEAYPREVRVGSCATYVEYMTGKRFLQSTAASVLRVIMTEDEWVFDGTYRFEGDSVVALVRHMCRHGLEFAPAAPGGEGTYRSLFDKMRGIYLHLGADDPQRDLERP